METLLGSLAMLMAVFLVALIGGLVGFYIVNKLGKFKDEVDVEESGDDNDISLPLFIKDVDLPKNVDKADVVRKVIVALAANGFKVSTVDKPWGIEFKIQEDQAGQFLEAFFEGDNQFKAMSLHPVGPKILVIEKGKRLSWHVHERKDADLRVLQGKVDVYVSWSDDESQPTTAITGDLISIPPLLRHRLGSRDGWAIIAEISRNIDPDHPSDDSDERRIADDFGRV